MRARAEQPGVAVLARFACASLIACAAFAPSGPATGREALDRVLEDVIAAVDAGRFARAEQLIAAADPADPALAFQRERMRRIRLDFPHDRAAIEAQLRRTIPDYTSADFDAWDAAGKLEHIDIDGERRWFARAASNLFRLDAAALARRDPKLPPLSEGPFERPHPHHAEVRDAARAANATHGAPRRVRVTHTLTVEADAVPAGKAIRAWIPYPRAIPGQQQDIRTIATSPAKHVVAPESALQRTVYLEQHARAGAPTAFSVTYELTIHGQYHAIDPDDAVSATPTPALAEHLAERPPHIVFTDAIRAYSRRVVGDDKNPYRIARKLFEAVDRDIPWAGAREYSTLTNIASHTLARGYGDCGQQTLLLIALLRLNGIPARWQSGWVWSDGDYSNLHDWGWLYLAPHGWLPMDVTTGVFERGDAALRDFYLGGLDAYRIAMNDDWGRELVPPKRHPRSDTVDSQRGEAEWDGGNLYFDQWDYDFDWQPLPLPAKR